MGLGLGVVAVALFGVVMQEQRAQKGHAAREEGVVPATVCATGCNRMGDGLQPYVRRAATVCAAGCNRMW